MGLPNVELVGPDGLPLPLYGSRKTALYQSSYLPPRALLAAENRRFAAVMGNGSTFLAPVTAYPTTTLTMALWNGEAQPQFGLNPGDPPRDYYIESAFVVLASGAANIGGMLLACVTMEAQAKPSAYANTVISSLSGIGQSKAIFANAITLTGAQPAWLSVATGPPSGTAFTTIATIAQGGFDGGLVDGGLRVPPGYMCGLTFLSGAGTAPLYGFGLVWSEV